MGRAAVRSGGRRRARVGVSCRAFPRPAAEIQGEGGEARYTRRDLAKGAAAMAAVLGMDKGAGPAMAKLPPGFSLKKDLQDGYGFLYPFGWTEVEVQGQDVVYKDVIEPLESVSVNVIPTQTEKLSDLGSPEDVGKQLLAKVLTSPSQSPKLVGASVRQDKEGRDYYTIEYLTKAPNYIRHGITVIAISNGKFYICNTGANEKRWDSMKDKLKVVVNSFELVPPLAGAVGATVPTF